MNKAELIRAVESRLGSSRKSAQDAVDGVVDTIVRSVARGERVAITGFGVFEKRARGARTARNPKTGAAVKVKATSVPAFRAGSSFKDVVSGAKKLTKAVTSSTGRSSGGGSARTTSSSTKTRAAKALATKRPAKTAAAKTSAAKRLAKRSTTKKATARKTTAKKTAKKAAKKAR